MRSSGKSEKSSTGWWVTAAEADSGESIWKASVVNSTTTTTTGTTSSSVKQQRRSSSKQGATRLRRTTASNYARFAAASNNNSSARPGSKLLTRSTRTTTTAGEGRTGTRANSPSGMVVRRMPPPGSNFPFDMEMPPDSSSSSEDGMSSSSSIIAITTSPGIPTVGGDSLGARRILDIHQISSRLHRSFEWEGQNYPHTLVLSSFYIVPLIVLLGILVACIWLFCACCYYTMIKIKLSSFCPGRRKSKKERNGNNPNEEAKKEILTPEILEMRRQDRLRFLQAECANLEQQLTGLRAQQNEKSATLTSRASDSDLEYLGASESPPLKRNSISLQDIPQSVIRIRREKELRQIKEEIEYLKSIAQQEKAKAAAVAKGILKGTLLVQEFELPGSKPSSPSETKVEPLSQHISHLKTQRKLNEIRSELEDLAMQLLHADEIKAKRSSFQELPRTALNIQREQNLISMTNEIQKIKNYRLQKRNVIETALEKTNQKGSPAGKKAAAANSGPGGADKSGSKSFSSINESPSTADTAAKYSDPDFVHSSSIRRQREQELNRVRVELKDLAYKLNLNPMNYISEDRVRLVPSQSMQSTSSGQSSHSPKRQSTSSGLNHV